MSDEATGKRPRRAAKRPLIRVILGCATYRWPSAERAPRRFFLLAKESQPTTASTARAQGMRDTLMKRKNKTCFFSFANVVSDSSRAPRSWKGLVEIKLPFVRRVFEKANQIKNFEGEQREAGYRLCQIAGLLLARLVGIYVYLKQISAAWVLGRRAYVYLCSSARRDPGSLRASAGMGIGH